MKSNLKNLPLDELTKWVQNYVADEHVSDQIISIIYKGDMMASALNELNPSSEYANILVQSWEKCFDGRS